MEERQESRTDPTSVARKTNEAIKARYLLLTISAAAVAVTFVGQQTGKRASVLLLVLLFFVSAAVTVAAANKRTAKRQQPREQWPNQMDHGHKLVNLVLPPFFSFSCSCFVVVVGLVCPPNGLVTAKMMQASFYGQTMKVALL